MPSGTNSLTLGSLLRRLLVVDMILAALIATTNGLTLYMGGEAIGASQPATIGALVSGWILTFIGVTIFQGFFLAIFGFVGVFIVSALYKTADEKQSAALNKAFRWGGMTAFGLASLVAVYNGFVQYGLLSAAHADPTLNLITAILTSVLVAMYGTFVIGFIGLIATIVFSVFAVALSGGFKRQKDAYGPNADPKPEEPKKEEKPKE